MMQRLVDFTDAMRLSITPWPIVIATLWSMFTIRKALIGSCFHVGIIGHLMFLSWVVICSFSGTLLASSH